MKNFETVADTRWGTKKVRRGSHFNTTVSHKSLSTLATELPLRIAGSVIPFAMGNLAGEVIENVPIVDQYSSSSTNMLLGIIAGAIGFMKSGINLDEKMQIESITVAPLRLDIK